MLKPYAVTYTIYHNNSIQNVETIKALLEEQTELESEVIEGSFKLATTFKETTMTMEELWKQDSELVIQYLKEHGITTCPMNF
jgi:hypothetical protein